MIPTGTPGQATVAAARRFLLHGLPKGFRRLRQYGFLANRVRQQKLSLCRALLSSAREDCTSSESLPNAAKHITIPIAGRGLVQQIVSGMPPARGRGLLGDHLANREAQAHSS